jgi:hypothetical protein
VTTISIEGGADDDATDRLWLGVMGVLMVGAAAVLIVIAVNGLMLAPSSP